ncbi:uncharacterized protein Z518_09948 [Rhinocladiella mackenziei CBS 650.93]|uniref:Nitrogen permease regulator Npr2 n=1 Tax=Rhinocladiella mackenziei CBS 650.93 TaxID=1442369 RepID=A0A0D2GRD8_9EURO|nr:uncharacterized protein Z518_09948 [Rhinocladiella mackenziei CBS 650.93]KIX00883.1 hypothetical protein Z518_09948 [Rhinocladiella mackenziei CBS 650.93]
MSIKAIFYSKFDPHEGPKIVHQVPEDSVLTTTDLPASNGIVSSTPLLSFSTISRFVIPRQSLCGNLISLSPPPLTPSMPPTLVLSHPICITSDHYPRNQFIFNFALVLGEPSTIDVASYKSVVKKLAHLMRSLEEQSRFLSDDTAAPNSGKIYSLCEMLMEDLNNYCECMIPIDEFNTLNIKLFPTLPNPASVKPWHVPLFTVRIETMVDENWDLTMLRIIPYINGVNSVKRIAALADADLKLTKKCVKHLLYYGCVLLLDIFSFHAIYAPTAEFANVIAKDIDMQRECARYVNTAFAPSAQEEAIIDGSTERRTSGLTSVNVHDDDIWPVTGKGDPVDGVGIVQLFASLRQGLTVREWYVQNANMLANIDMRRFVTFGVIKGFLYRVHRYAIRTQKATGLHNQHNTEDTQYLTRSMSSERHFSEEPSRRNMKHNSHANGKNGEYGHDLNARIAEFLDGTHCFDEICTELEISEKELTERLKSRDMGEVVIICR